VLYSSFFTNLPRGVYDSLLTYTYWFKTSGNANVYPLTKYLEWLVVQWNTPSLELGAEFTAMVLGTFGAITALVQARSRFAVFSAFWALGIFAAYSLVPYKTPWLALSIVLPFIVTAGYLLEQLYERRSLQIVAVFILAISIAYSSYAAVQLSFFRYDDESEPYSYAHSRRDLLNLVGEIENIAAGNPAGKEIGITIVSPEHWPLPWYLRDFPNVGYWGKVVETDQPIVIALESQRAEVERQLGGKYRLFSERDLRPGNRLLLYLRKDVQP
jgi:predicted membrane-bound mannosyltransferase